MGCGCSTHVKEVEYNKQPNDTHSGKKRAPNLGEGKTFHSDVGNEESAFVGALAKQGSVKDFRSKYDLSQATELGHGACGSVVAVKRRDTGDLYAMKTVTLDSMGVDSFDELNIEIDLQKRLDHPNICKIIESFEDRKRGIMYIIMELCTGGSLVSRMKTHRKGYGERAAATLVEKMLSAIIYCHHHGVVHRDIKLDNMIYEHEGENNSPLALQLRLTSHLRSPLMSHLSPLTSSASPRIPHRPGEDAELKLIDFGFAAKVRQNREGMWDQLGTPSYMAPELWSDTEVEYDSSVDTWALGVVTYMLLSGKRPFDHQNKREKKRMIEEDPVEVHALPCFETLLMSDAQTQGHILLSLTRMRGAPPI